MIFRRKRATKCSTSQAFLYQNKRCTAVKALVLPSRTHMNVYDTAKAVVSLRTLHWGMSYD
jgi:hypothetical protein